VRNKQYNALGILVISNAFNKAFTYFGLSVSSFFCSDAAVYMDAISLLTVAQLIYAGTQFLSLHTSHFHYNNIADLF
jgi:hypothetical protein